MIRLYSELTTKAAVISMQPIVQNFLIFRGLIHHSFAVAGIQGGFGKGVPGILF